MAKLKELGFDRYEVSNFCKRGKESRHNLNYWNRGEYIGFGVSVSSHIDNVRFTNTFDLDEYFKCIMSNHFAVVNSEKVEKQGAMEESIMLAMRTAKGLNLAKFEKEFSCSFRTEYADALEKNAEYLEEEEGYLRIKPEYLYVQNTIICAFFKE